MPLNPRLDGQAVPDVLSKHGLAVKLHSSAIEKTLELQKQKENTFRPLDGQIIQEWQSAFKAWYDVWLDNEYWQGVEQRALELGKTDRRLKVTDIYEIRSGFPAALLSINAKIASDDLRVGCTVRAAQHLKLGLCSGFPMPAVEQAYSHLLDPLKDKLKDLFEDAKTKVGKDDTQAHRVFNDLCSKAEPVFDQISKVDSTNLLSIDTIKDEFSDVLRSVAIAYVNKTNDTVIGGTMIQKALDFAVSTSVRKRLEDDMQAIRKMQTQGLNVSGNFDPSKCWYCEDQPADAASAKVISMHKVLGTEQVGWNQVRTQYRNLDLQIPRCKHCHNQHKKVGSAQILGVVLYFALFIVLAVAVSPVLFWVIFVPPAWIIAYLLYRMVRYINISGYCSTNHVKTAKGEGKFSECPLYTAATGDGYVLGKFNTQQ